MRQDGKGPAQKAEKIVVDKNKKDAILFTISIAVVNKWFRCLEP